MVLYRTLDRNFHQSEFQSQQLSEALTIRTPPIQMVFRDFPHFLAYGKLKLGQVRFHSLFFNLLISFESYRWKLHSLSCRQCL